MNNSEKGRVVGVITPRRGTPAPAGVGARPPVPSRAPALRLVDRRPDRGSAQAVDAGVAVFSACGQIDAINYFISRGIPLRTISRVLWHPELRRGSTR